jgi:hypothetical protein
MVTAAWVLVIFFILLLIKRIFVYRFYKGEIETESIIQDQPDFTTSINPHNGTSGIVPGGVSWTQPQTRWGRR